MLICKFCGDIRKSEKSLVQHQIKCKNNPNRVLSSGFKGHIPWNKGLNKSNSDIVKQQSEELKEKYKNGILKPMGCCSKKFKDSDKFIEACKKGGGYRKNSGRSKKFNVIDSYNNKVTLQSSYEYDLHLILKELNIKWVRPKHLKYDNKKYFPDFYLTEYNIYLDPKNNFLYKKDLGKINKVKKQNKVQVYILTRDLINKNYILMLCSSTVEQTTDNR